METQHKFLVKLSNGFRNKVPIVEIIYLMDQIGISPTIEEAKIYTLAYLKSEYPEVTNPIEIDQIKFEVVNGTFGIIKH